MVVCQLWMAVILLFGHPIHFARFDHDLDRTPYYQNYLGTHTFWEVKNEQVAKHCVYGPRVWSRVCVCVLGNHNKIHLGWAHVHLHSISCLPVSTFPINHYCYFRIKFTVWDKPRPVIAELLPRSETNEMLVFGNKKALLPFYMFYVQRSLHLLLKVMCRQCTYRGLGATYY